METVREEYVRKMRDNYPLIIRTLMHDIIVSVDKNGDLVFVNDAAVEFLGKSSEELIGTNFIEYLHPEDVDKAKVILQELMEGKDQIKGFILRVTSPQGLKTVAMNGISIFDDEGNFIGAHITGKDLTDLLRTEEELEQSRSHFRRMFEVMVDPVVIVDLTGIILELSQSAEEVLGFPKEELVGKNFLETEVATAESKTILTKNLERLKKGKPIPPYTIEAVTKDGNKLLYEVNPARIMYRSQPAILAIFRNITERKMADEALRESERRFRELSELLHEVIFEIDYPKREVIVVDYGSTDRTYQLASNYRTKGVKVICRAVAGNVKVLNRTSLLTKCQALEYIVNENIYRRVFDIFGVVPVVPGPLASFRKETLKEIGFYDRDTLTEDFDITVKILKTQRVVQALSDANVYTEAPVTWKDFSKQRTRWNRGTFQTIIKHRNVFSNARFGYLRNLTFQYVILSMVFVPFVSIVSLIVIALAVLTGYALQVLIVMAVFMLIQTTYSFLAIIMDDEDWKLAIYSPLFVVGFKEVRNFIKIKALFDILSRREMKWGTLQRIGASETKAVAKPVNYT